MDKALTRTARYLAVGGVAWIVFGAIVLFWPGVSLVALTALFGAFVFVYGTFAVGSGLTLLAHKRTDWVAYIVGGLAGIVIGVITFLHPAVTVLALTYLVAAWAFIIGVVEIMGAIEVWGVVPGAAWTAVGGVLSIIFASVVAFWPGAGLMAILWLIAFYAILGGMLRLVASYRIHQFHSEVKAAIGGMQPTAG